MIAHVVLFEPKVTTGEAGRAEFLEAMKVAFSQIPSVTRSMVASRVTVGAGYESTIGDETYSYVNVVEFEDVAGLKAYLDHPLHQRLGQLFWENCNRTLIIDSDSIWLNTKKINNSRS
jgi:hypothetical protein